MNNLKEIINNLNIKFELSKEIRKGETANTYLGNYQNEKSILKLFKKNHNKLITNQYLDNEINNQLINKNFPPLSRMSDSENVCRPLGGAEWNPNRSA